MDIFPQLLGEAEFRHFTPDDYGDLNAVLDEITAGYLLSYLENPAGDAEIKDKMNQYLRNAIDSLTFHTKLKEAGLVDLVKNLSPESLAMSNVDLVKLVEQLSFLEQNSDKIKTTIPARSSKAYHNFYDAMGRVVTRMMLSGTQTTYPDIMDRIEANKFLFYQTGEKDHPTGVGILNSKRRQWVVALNGARWLLYCKDKGITAAERSKF